MSATLSEDTTEELADKGFVAIPEEEWENIRNQVHQNTQETSDLQEEIENQSQNVVGAFSKLSSIDDRVTELEEGNDTQDENPGIEPDSSRKTPLERIVNTPEHMVEQLGLSANQERSRNIARDVHEYAEKAPAGLVIDSSTIRKVITAREDSPAHTQTVSRVMDFLEQLGKDGVELIKRRGQRMVVFSEDLADRMKAHRCDRGSGPNSSEPVIQPG